MENYCKMQAAGTMQRLQWIDAMRGFSMLVVVFVHLLTWSNVTSGDSPLVSALMTFWMPLFFFVSGFFSYRKPSNWSRSKLSGIMKRKVQAQIIGTFVFCGIYGYVMNGHVSFANGVGAYWFTIVLFQMYILYLVFSLLSRAFGRDISIPVMVIISILLCGSLFVYKYDFKVAWMFRWLNLAQYLQFFTLGLICNRYKDKFMRLLSDSQLFTAVMGGGILSLLLMNSEWFSDRFVFLSSFNRNLVVRYCMLLSVICLFYRHSSVLSGASKGARLLCFIGRRTLDIYFIHFFFLPKVDEISGWLTNGNMIIFQIMYASILTCAVTAICLLISSILRSSPAIASWLFGEKSRQITSPIIENQNK